MTTVLQWTALVVCFACLVWRLPAAIKGRNISLFWCFALITVALGLSIPAIYLPVDGLLGGGNVANLLLHLSVDLLFFVLCGKVANAYRAKTSLRLIRGRIGQVVLVLAVIATLVAFGAGEHKASSTGLAGLADQPAIAVYGFLGLAYPSYAAACLVWPTLRAGILARRAIDKASAFLLSTGFALVVVSLIGRLAGRGRWEPDGLPFTAVLCVAAGLALVWISSFRPRRSAA